VTCVNRYLINRVSRSQRHRHSTRIRKNSVNPFSDVDASATRAREKHVSRFRLRFSATLLSRAATKENGEEIEWLDRNKRSRETPWPITAARGRTRVRQPTSERRRSGLICRSAEKRRYPRQLNREREYSRCVYSPFAALQDFSRRAVRLSRGKQRSPFSGR